MKFTINTSTLNHHIQHAAKAISNRTTIPILTGIKMEATNVGIYLTASDTNISIQTHIPLEDEEHVIAEITATGSVVLPAKLLTELIRKLPNKQVEVEVKDNFQTMIRSGQTEVEINGLDPEEYPLLPSINENNTLVISSDILKLMIKETIFSVSHDESAAILTGVMFSLDHGKLTFTATDRHRLALKEMHVESAADITFKNIVVSGKNLNELYKILSEQSEAIHIIVSDNQILFKINNILFYSRILDGVYPDTTRIIPAQSKTDVIVNKQKLLQAIDRASLLSREQNTNIVKMTVDENNGISISSSSSTFGKINEEIKMDEFSGDEVNISFNSKYMLDVLKVLDAEQVKIKFTGAMSPILITPEDDNECVFLILPYRTG
ncbi:DNA polymerase III subunit beta [Longirhabdus pacifica]|uniref:DNA polymerase III subunit beta n=1 Tax=Longirhabdus pacifica TaxID=2305227 RepID=UPI001008A761|nr:DNA polymerase III subunit beta [Longirhabdus pacifica]